MCIFSHQDPELFVQSEDSETVDENEEDLEED